MYLQLLSCPVAITQMVTKVEAGYDEGQIRGREGEHKMGVMCMEVMCIGG